MKKIKTIYRLTVTSFYDEDSQEPYPVEFEDEDKAIRAFNGYYSERLLSGGHAYDVIGPDKVHIVELSDSELTKLEDLK